MQNDCNFITKFVIWLAFMQNYLYLCNRKGEKRKEKEETKFK